MMSGGVGRSVGYLQGMGRSVGYVLRQCALRHVPYKLRTCGLRRGGSKKDDDRAGQTIGSIEVAPRTPYAALDALRAESWTHACSVVATDGAEGLRQGAQEPGYSAVALILGLLLALVLLSELFSSPTGQTPTLADLRVMLTYPVCFATGGAHGAALCATHRQPAAEARGDEADLRAKLDEQTAQCDRDVVSDELDDTVGSCQFRCWLCFSPVALECRGASRRAPRRAHGRCVIVCDGHSIVRSVKPTACSRSSSWVSSARV